MSAVAIALPELWLPPSFETLKERFLAMAGSKSNYLAKKLVEEAHGGVAYVSAANVYLALCTAAIDDTSTGATITEATFGSYARTQIGTGNNQTDAWNAATGTTTATVTNKNAITCPTATSGTSTITYIAVLDSGTIGAGNILVWASVTSTVINNGDTPKVNAAALSIVED
jgi:hypothetical protein